MGSELTQPGERLGEGRKVSLSFTSSLWSRSLMVPSRLWVDEGHGGKNHGPEEMKTSLSLQAFLSLTWF